MQNTTNTQVRDVSGVVLPPRIRWSRKLIVCPFCKRATPATEAFYAGSWQTFMPYPCDCSGYRAAVERMERAGSRRVAFSVPERFRDTAAKTDVSALVGTIEQGCGLYLHGSNGTWKTTTAYAIAARLTAEGWRVEKTTLAQIAAQLHDAFTTRETQAEVLGHLASCDVLILDDLGKEVPSERTGELLYRVVNARYERRRNVVITSNYSRGELAARLAQGCDEPTARAIASRLAEMTVPIEMGGEDRRRSA